MHAPSDRRRVELAVQYIAAHLVEPLTVREVAEAAGLSEFHFHRIFSATVGETVGRFITRRRLELAALRLAYDRERSISEIAVGSGYSSPSNFTKAFTAFFGCSPTRVRHPDAQLPAAVGTLTRSYGKHFDPRQLYELPAGLAGDAPAGVGERVRFEDSRGFQLVGLHSPAGYDVDTVTALYGELVARAQQLGFVDREADTWGIAFDSPQLTAPQLCRYDACLAVPAGTRVASPLFTTSVPAGRYAVFSFDGPLVQLEPLYRWIYAAWLPGSSLEADDFTVLEHHTGDGPVDGRVALEVWIKVRPQGGVR